MKTRIIKSFQCGVCERVFGNNLDSDQCCSENFRTCLCGAPKYEWRNKCNDCHACGLFEKAELVDSHGPYWDESICEMFYEVDEYLDFIDNIDREETYELFCTRTIEWKPFDVIESAIEDSLLEHHEDAFDQIVDYDELLRFVAEWSKKQQVSSYDVDYSRKIRISKEEIDNYLKETAC